MLKVPRVSDVVKANGMSSVKELCEMTGQSYATLGNWYKKKRDLFDIVLIGAVFIKKTHAVQNQVDNLTHDIDNLNWGLRETVKQIQKAKIQNISTTEEGSSDAASEAGEDESR